MLPVGASCVISVDIVGFVAISYLRFLALARPDEDITNIMYSLV